MTSLRQACVRQREMTADGHTGSNGPYTEGGHAQFEGLTELTNTGFTMETESITAAAAAPVQQRTPEWLSARAGKFTASRLAALMARTRSGPAASRANLIVELAVERLTGTCDSGYSNGAMQRGVELEPEARVAYELAAGVSVVEVGFCAHPLLAHVGCSPDGLVGAAGLVEIKCPAAMARHAAALLHGTHADDYRWQVQGQLWVTGRQWCDVVSYDPRFPAKLQLAIRRVEPDSDAIAELEHAVAEAEAEVAAMVTQLTNKET